MQPVPRTDRETGGSAGGDRTKVGECSFGSNVTVELRIFRELSPSSGIIYLVGILSICILGRDNDNGGI